MEPPSPHDARVQAAWAAHRPYLLAIAAGMLKRRDDAEDAVQEAFARLAAASPDAIEDMRGWLVVVTRRQWQILHILSRSPQDTAALTDAIRPFLSAGAVTLDEATGELARRGWLTRDEAGRYALTAAGQAGHAAVDEKLNELFRSTFLTGLTQDDYYGTMRILQRMAENLERAAGV